MEGIMGCKWDQGRHQFGEHQQGGRGLKIQIKWNNDKN